MIWIWFLVYLEINFISIYNVVGILKVLFYFNLEDLWLNHRKNIGVQEGIYNSNKDLSVE